MLTQTTITAGIEFDADNNPLSEERQGMALAIARATLAKEYGGYTETRSMGGWINDEGILITEAGRQWTISGESATLETAQQKANKVAETIREAFHQASVIASVIEARYTFVSQPAKVK